nr:tyrosine-protein kinase [Tanacetum cinerariifolium]
DKQKVKNVDDQEIENIKDEEGKNVKDKKDSKGDDTHNDDVSYMRQPIEDESWLLAHEIDYPNRNEEEWYCVISKATEGGRGKRVLAAALEDGTALFLEP